MGRVSRYKKVKSIDPFAKNGSWKSDIGDCSTLKRVKRKSKTAIRMKEQKINKLQRRRGGKANAGDRKKSGGCNGYGDDDGYDLPPDGEDEFDLSDILGSVKKQPHKINPLLDDDGTDAQRLIAKPSLVGAATATSVGKKTTDNNNMNAPSSKKQKQKNNDTNDIKQKKMNKANVKYDGTQPITAKTSTKEIIAAFSNPNKQKQTNNNNNDNDATSSTSTKKDKKKAFLAKKKTKKRKQSGMNNYDSDDDYAHQQALQALHSQSSSTSTTHTLSSTTQNTPKKQHEIQQPNYSHTMIARSSLNDQVERPPTFSTLPRGANKLSKNKTKQQKHGDTAKATKDEEDNSDKAMRIRKEQQALEAMRARVMAQYAVLRESRRSGR